MDKDIHMMPIKSSNLAAVGHDAKTNTLRVEFIKRSKGKEILPGNVWDYSPVTEEGFKEMMKADSKGSYFHNNIRLNNAITPTKIY